MTLADMYIYGSRARFEGVEASPSDVAVVAPAPEPVDWVGHFDDVSSERQNVLLAAWIEGQLDDVESSDAADLESPDASDRSRKAR